MAMSSSVPYLLNAIYEWILDNQCTPYMVVDATHAESSVPVDHVKDGQIVLNISPTAVRDLRIEQEFVEFGGRFAGVPHAIHVPMDAVLGIVSKENNEGMWFPRKEENKEASEATQASDPPKKKGPPDLRIVE